MGGGDRARVMSVYGFIKILVTHDKKGVTS
jgi:hypothetical protein